MLLVEFDVMDYASCLDLQRSIVEQKLTRGADNVLLLLEHPPTVTLGFMGSVSDLLMPEPHIIASGIAVNRSDRGGQATYHGPGQLVAYPVVSLKTLDLSVRAYVHALEETILQTLGHFGVKAFRKEKTVGIWTGPEEKIASIGVKVRRRIAYHGFSLNVNLAQDPTHYVICCGMPHARMVSMTHLLHEDVSVKAVRRQIAQSFSRVFRVTLEPCTPEEFFETYPGKGHA